MMAVNYVKLLYKSFESMWGNLEGATHLTALLVCFGHQRNYGSVNLKVEAVLQPVGSSCLQMASVPQPTWQVDGFWVMYAAAYSELFNDLSKVCCDCSQVHLLLCASCKPCCHVAGRLSMAVAQPFLFV